MYYINLSLVVACGVWALLFYFVRRKVGDLEMEVGRLNDHIEELNQLVLYHQLSIDESPYFECDDQGDERAKPKLNVIEGGKK